MPQEMKDSGTNISLDNKIFSLKISSSSFKSISETKIKIGQSIQIEAQDNVKTLNTNKQKNAKKSARICCSRKTCNKSKKQMMKNIVKNRFLMPGVCCAYKKIYIIKLCVTFKVQYCQDVLFKRAQHCQDVLFKRCVIQESAIVLLIFIRPLSLS